MASRAQRFDPRQIMYRENFEIFHYREPKPANVEVHHHDFYEVYLLLEGCVEYWVEGTLYKLDPGDIFLISPMKLHRPVVDPQSKYERIVLWINKDFLETLSKEGFDLTACFNSDGSRASLIRPSNTQYASISLHLLELTREYNSKEFGNELAAHGILLQFMVELNRIANKETSLPSQKKRGSKLVGQVLSYINEHGNETLSLDDIAAHFYVSKYYLSHEFSRETGVGVYRYIMMKRLLLAKQLLADGTPAGVVCFRCGFKDYTSFYRAFKSEYGISPKVFAGTQE